MRGPQNFHEAAMFAERADSVITCVSGQDTQKSWQKGYKGGLPQRQHTQVKSSGGETSASGSGGPEPMELGVALSSGHCLVANTKSYVRKMHVFTIASQTQGTSHVTAL